MMLFKQGHLYFDTFASFDTETGVLVLNERSGNAGSVVYECKNYLEGKSMYECLEGLNKDIELLKKEGHDAVPNHWKEVADYIPFTFEREIIENKSHSMEWTSPKEQREKVNRDDVISFVSMIDENARCNLNLTRSSIEFTKTITGEISGCEHHFDNEAFFLHNFSKVQKDKTATLEQKMDALQEDFDSIKKYNRNSLLVNKFVFRNDPYRINLFTEVDRNFDVNLLKIYSEREMQKEIEKNKEQESKKGKEPSHGLF